ncbi:MAG: protamine-2 (modular protein) [Rhizobiaceae bacterium]
MDRRLFLAGLFGVAGTAALATVARPVDAAAGVPGNGPGILDALDDPVVDELDVGPETAEPELIWHRGYYHEGRRRRRRRRRHAWRTVCRRYWDRGRWRRRCYRRRVSFWIYL